MTAQVSKFATAMAHHAGFRFALARLAARFKLAVPKSVYIWNCCSSTSARGLSAIAGWGLTA
jgi:hypothetical protein